MTLNKNVPINPVAFNSVGKRAIKFENRSQHRKSTAEDHVALYADSEEDGSEPDIELKQPKIMRTPRQQEIRKMLHPELSKQCLESGGVWIPGHYSEQQASREDKKTIKVLLHKRYIHTSTRSQASTN